MSHRLCIAALLCCVAAPLGAQRRPVRAITPPPPPTTTMVDTGHGGFALDFQDQDIRVVLSALAEAGKVNLSFGNLPPRKVTLRMARPATTAEFTNIIRGIAEANDLRVTENGPIIQVSAPPAAVVQSPQQQLQQALQQNELRLYIYQLKHASATQLAPVLMSLFSGSSTTRSTVATQNGILQTTTPNVIGGAAGGGFGGAGGGGRRGGGGGGAGGGAANTGTAASDATGTTATVFGGRGGAAALQQVLQQAGAGALSGNAADVRIVGEETSNSLLVRSTAADWALIQQVVAGVDQRPMQVLIEVTIAEVQRTHDLDYGISTSSTRKSGSQGDTASFPTAATARDFILTLTGGKGAIDYNVAINALQTRGDVRILSLPVIIAQNNRQAVLNVGEQRPFVNVSQTVVTGTVPTTVQTITYLSVGTVLTITPTINPDGYVNLQVDQTDNSATDEIEFNAPVISQREATTQVFLKDGQTTVIGGLAGKTESKTVSGIPILSKIPIIGGLLFGNTQKSTVTSELFLFLTPHVISTDDDIDRLKKAVQSSSELLQQVPVGPRIVPNGDTINISIDSLRRRADSAAAAAKKGGRGGGGGSR
ncbi:MAG TPA: secretin N-terminal domain-containing protein [Gemmatimonadales bacterium]|nr:secretin N-terminal domain-containing protein [Gemmatimonadales bacterium]